MGGERELPVDRAASPQGVPCREAPWKGVGARRAYPADPVGTCDQASSGSNPVRLQFYLHLDNGCEPSGCSIKSYRHTLLT